MPSRASYLTSSSEEAPFEADYPRKRRKSAADFYRVEPVHDSRIHIVGIGSVGRFIAHSLRGIPNPPPITLLFHKRNYLKRWQESGKGIALQTGDSVEVHDGYDAEYFTPRVSEHRKVMPVDIDEHESKEPISSLIVAVKAPMVRSSLLGLRHRLGPESTILFLQNGMGTLEELDKDIFPDPETRPHYMFGINSHGLNIPMNDEPFRVIHAGFGTMALGILPQQRTPYSPTPQFSPNLQSPRTYDFIPSPAENTPAPQEPGFRWAPTSRYLLRTMLRTPVFCATGYAPADLLQQQLEKLVVNSVINPLTCLLDARNGAILYNFHLTRVMRLLISEASLVIRSLPELQYIPNVDTRFDPGRLETLVVGVANRTKENVSSMLSDMRNGRNTEIDYINGWIVKKGEELGIRCFMHYMVLHLVRGKSTMISKELNQEVPLVGDALSVLEDKEGEGKAGGDL